MSNSATRRKSIEWRNVPPTMKKLFADRNTPGGGLSKKGTQNRRIIAKGEDEFKREVTLHATKGYRHYKSAV